MAIRRKDFQKLVGLVKEFLSKLPSNEVTAELRDALHLSLLHMHRYYKRIRLQAHSAATVALETSLSLFHHWNGSMSPVSPHMPPAEKFDWRWMSLDASKLSASFGHSDFGNIVPEIFYVIKEGNVQELKRMINEEPDLVHETDALGRTTAMYAVHGNTLEHLRCLQALQENGVDFNTQANDGSTSLHIAAHSRNLDMLQEIIKQKVNVNAEDHDGHTALHWASMYPESSMVKVLLNHGASCSSEDRDGLTPPMWACYFDHVDNLDFQLSGIRKEFPSFDVVANMRDKKSKSIIHWAVSRPGNSECIKFLLTPQNAVLKEKDGKSVFLVAAEHGCVAGCEEILALCGTGVVDDVDNLGRTALHLASLNGHGEVIDLLLNKGASQYAKDAKGMTPLDYIKCRQLNYCSLVFLSYKAYDEKIHNPCVSNLDGIVGEKNIERMCPLEGNKRENTHTVSEQKQPVASTTYDIWRADVDEVEGFETQREDFESTPLKANDNMLQLLRSTSKRKTREGTHEFSTADLDLPETVDEDKKVSHTDIHDILEDPPASPHVTDTDACERSLYETENNNYTITANNKRDEPLDFDLDDQVLVLVEHPGSDDEHVVFRYGNEFLENETVTECPAEVDAEVDCRLHVDADHDLLDVSHTPRLPTVTATSEPSAAVVSASVNLSVPSFGSDSESEDLDKNHTETNAVKDEGSFVAEHKLDSGDIQVKEDVPMEEQPSPELSTNDRKNDQVQEERPSKEDQASERKSPDTKRSSHIPVPATRGGIWHSSSSGFPRERPGSSGLLLSLPASPRASSLGSLEPLTLVQPVSPLGKTSHSGLQKAPYGHHMGRSNSTENLDWRGRAVPAGNTRVNRRNSAGSLIPRPASPKERPQSAPGSNTSYIPKPPLSR